MDLASMGVLVGFAGAGWALGNYEGDPDPRGRDGLVTFAPMVLMVMVGFALYVVANQGNSADSSVVETWIFPVLGAGIGFVVGRLVGPVLKGRRW